MAEDLRIALQKLKARLARLLRDAASDDNDAGACEMRVISGPNGQWIGERDGVINVIRFGFGAGAIDVDENNFAADTAHDEGKRGSRADHAATNDSNFHADA